jgi:uncharacterized OB-fold protein
LEPYEDHLLEPARAIDMVPYVLELEYRHSYGPYYGPLFDEIASHKRILGRKCPSCGNVLVPPRGYCELCLVKTTEWDYVADTGVVQGASIIHLKFEGQSRPPPYIYAEIILDGASTRLIHTVGEITMEEAKTRVVPGVRVKAVWKEGAHSGSLSDIDYFVLMQDNE